MKKVLMLIMLTLTLFCCKTEEEELYCNSYPVGYMLSIIGNLPEGVKNVKVSVEILDDLGIGIFKENEGTCQFYPYYDEDAWSTPDYVPSFRKGLERKFRIKIYNLDKVFFDDILTVKTVKDYVIQDNLVKTEILQFDNMDAVERVDFKERLIVLKDLK